MKLIKIVRVWFELLRAITIGLVIAGVIIFIFFAISES